MGYGLHGYYTDWETGLPLCGLRYHDSAAGRWLNREPMSYAGGVNVYEYCGNGPVGMSDASGMWGLPGLPSWIGGGVSCGFSLFADWIGASVGERSSVCTQGSQCLCSMLAALITGFIDVSDPMGIFWSGCISGSLDSLCSELAGYLCDLHDCRQCPHESLGCRVLGAVVGAVTGCFGGILGNARASQIGGEVGIGVGNWISGIVGTGLAGPAQAATDNDCQYGM